jgi:AraC-like DNA-binding protein
MNKRTYDITQEFIAACNLLNVDVEEVLREPGLQHFLTGELKLTMTPKQIALVFNAIVTLYGQDDFHIKLADGFAKGAFGNAFLALQCSETLREGIHRAARFKELLEPVKWTITESDDLFSVQLQSQSADLPFNGVSQIMSFLWLIKSCRNITAKHILPTRVCVTDPVIRQAEIEREIGCPIEGPNLAYLQFPAALMDTRIMSSSRYVTSGLDAGSTQSQRAVETGNEFVTAVRTNVLEILPSGVATSERVANRMGLSKRTFERRLSELDINYTDIVRECRMHMADHYLQETRLPIIEIGFLLGYREVNSFHRAFKDWHKKTPQEVRKTLVARTA